MLTRARYAVDKVDRSSTRQASAGRHAAVPPAATRLLGLQRTAGNRAVGSLVRVQRDFNEKFVGKLAEEREALEKWNSAGSGRSQGLIHVIDYAKARPPKAVNNVPTVTDTKLWATFTAGHALSGQQLARAFGKDPFEGETIRWLGAFTKQFELLFPAPQQIQVEIVEKEKTISELIQSAPNRAMAAKSAPVSDLKNEVAALKSRVLLENRWVIAREDSKKGRVERVEEAMMKKTGTRPSYAGDEILGVTGALDQLVAGNTTERKAKGFGEQITATNQWVKTAEGNAEKRASWEQQDTTFEGDAYEEEATPDGLRVIKWGPKGKTRYSTVMGGS